MRRQNFSDTVAYKTPEHLIVDFGGCPLSTADAPVIDKIKEFLGLRGNPRTGGFRLEQQRPSTSGS